MSSQSSHHVSSEDRCLLEGLEPRRLFAASATRIGDVLGFLADNFSTRPEAHQSRAVYRNKAYALADAQPNKGMVRTVGDTVMVKAVANFKGGKKLAAQLEAIGAAVTGVYGVMLSANVPVSALASVASLSALNYADASYAPITSAGRTESYGEQSMNSDRGRHRYGVDGTGVTVGVISDSYNNKTAPFTNAAGDIATGDLPAGGVNLLQEAPAAGSDEGRAMLQIVHDVAPGAALAFHSANVSEADFAAGIVELAKPVASGGAGAKVVVDDVRYYDEPYFQDGIVAQAVTTAYNTYGTSYFSSAGNQADESYEQTFRPTASLTVAGAGAAGVFHDFDSSATTNVYQAITIPAGTQIILGMQWDAPYASASANAGGAASPTNSVGLYLINAAKTAALASSTTSRVGSDAYQILGYTNSGASAITAYVAMKVTAGANPGYVKHVLYNGTIVDFDTNSPTASGHNIAPGAVAVGAAFFANTPAFNVSPPLKESFTSLGGAGIRFNANGTAKASTEVRNQPLVTGPDGAATTFFSSQLVTDAQFHFYGTSAAAPHVAAVAALMIQSKPSITNAQIYTAMQNTSIDMGSAGFDFTTGYGLVQADQALDSISASSISGTAYRDLNNNGVKDGSDTFVTGQSVFLDQNNNGVLDSSSGTVSGSPAQAIPDGGATFSVPSRISTTLATSFGGRVTGLTVNVNATHTFASDLGFTLITPSGVRIPLTTVLGNYNGGGTGYNLTFSDSAATYVQSVSSAGVLAGTYKPQTPLAQAIGENATGTWTLESRDYLQTDTGTLNSWSLTVTYADPSTTTNGSGTYAFSNLPTSTYFGTYRVRVAALAGFTQTVPASPYNLTLTPSTNSTARDFAFASLAPTIGTLLLDDGTTQRSRIRSMDVTIIGTIPVGNILAGAFTLTQTSGPVIQSYGVTVTGVTTPVAGQTKISLAFTGAGVVAGSVADGRFTLSIDGSKMSTSGGIQVDALGNGVAGSVRPYLFHRIFGDYDGDAGVSILDFNVFTPAFGSTSPAPAFKSPFDYDGDNGISIIDFNQFSPRFGKSV